MERQPTVYILASRRNGTLYVGVTSDLVGRIWLHRNDLVEGFTKDYGVHMLVYHEQHLTIYGAITREKQIKELRRAWKLRLIEERNPTWRDLSEEIFGNAGSRPASG
jgi:putative endonuclease